MTTDAVSTASAVRAASACHSQEPSSRLERFVSPVRYSTTFEKKHPHPFEDKAVSSFIKAMSATSSDTVRSPGFPYPDYQG